jgi:hypothetical protein
MHIDRDIKLDFKDVLIRPKRSALPSRAGVDITREFSFKHSGKRYRGVPVIAANMDTVGTLEMARALAPFGLSAALHKHYGVDELVTFFKALKLKSNAFYSLGNMKNDLDKFERVPRLRGQGSAGAVSRPGGRYLAGYPRRPALRLHLRRGAHAEGTHQAHHVRAGGHGVERTLRGKLTSAPGRVWPGGRVARWRPRSPAGLGAAMARTRPGSPGAP